MTVYTENNVPVLFRGPEQKIGMSEDGYVAVQKAHAAALRAIEKAGAGAEKLQKTYDDHYLIADAVVVHNPDPARPPFSTFSIGASDLDEALKEVIQAFDLQHIGVPDETSDHLHTPEWVASTNDELARLLADYYGCEVRALAEVI